MISVVAPLELGFLLQPLFILDAIIAGQSADQLAALPVGENAAETFTRDARHRREIALADLLVDDDAASANILAEVVRQVEQRAGNTAAQRQESPGGILQTAGPASLIFVGLFHDAIIARRRWLP
jgi:hypothetical protein